MATSTRMYFDECVTLQLQAGDDDAENSANYDSEEGDGLIPNTASLVKWHQQECTDTDEIVTCETRGPFWSMLNDFATMTLHENAQQDGSDSNAIAIAWSQNLAQCPSMADPNNEEQDSEAFIYASFMCNPEGTGLEVAVFENDSCTLYNPHVSYQELILAEKRNSNDESTLDNTATDYDVAWNVVQSSRTRAYGRRRDIHNAIVRPFMYSTDCSTTSTSEVYDEDTSLCTKLQSVSVDTATCDPVLDNDNNYDEEVTVLSSACGQLLQHQSTNFETTSPPIYQVDDSGRLFTYQTSAIDRAMEWITHPLVEMAALVIIASILLRAMYDIYRDEDEQESNKDKTPNNEPKEPSQPTKDMENGDSKVNQNQRTTRQKRDESKKTTTLSPGDFMSLSRWLRTNKPAPVSKKQQNDEENASSLEQELVPQKNDDASYDGAPANPPSYEPPSTLGTINEEDKGETSSEVQDDSDQTSTA